MVWRFRAHIFVGLALAICSCKSLERQDHSATLSAGEPSPKCAKEGLIQPDVVGDSGSSDVRHYEVKVASETPRDSAEVVVVGAGLAGLTTAYRLNKAGIDVAVLEAAERIGGRINTIHFSDCTTAEAHMEEYWERSPALPLLRELGFVVVEEGKETTRTDAGPQWKTMIEDVAHSSVRIDGKIYPYTGDGDRETYLGGIFAEAEAEAIKRWSAATWKVYEKLHAWHKNEDEAIVAGKPAIPLPAELAELNKISFKDYVEGFKVNGKKLPRKVTEWVRVTVEPETAIEWDKITALDGIAEFRLFLDSPAGFGEKNYHVASGNINFIRALHSELKPGTVQTQSFVKAIKQNEDEVVVTYSHRGQDRQIRAKYAVVTVPLFAIDKIKFEPELTSERKKAIASTGFGSYVKVHYRLKQGVMATWRAHESKDKTLFTFLSDSPAGSIYNVSDLHGSDAAASDEPVTMTLLIHARFATEPQNGASLPLIKMAPTAAGVQVRKAIDDLFPTFSSHLIDTATYIYPTAVAYWPIAKGRSRFDSLASTLRRPQGRVFIGGDSTEDSHSEGAVAAAERMAKALIRLKGK